MKNKRQLAVVVALIRNKEGEILLQERLDSLIPEANLKWEFPGGRIDYGETPSHAVKRECREEIGCEIKIKKLLPEVQSSVWARTDGKEQQAIIFCYEAEIIDGEPKSLDKKVAKVGWFSRKEISSLDTLRGIKEFVGLLDK